MRMWKINPKKLCRQHLLGEHLEMHMFSSNIKQKKNLKGYIKSGLVECHNVKARHDLLAKEMKRRGYNHNSPIKAFKSYKAGKVCIKSNIKELKKRCKECRKLL